MLDKLSFSSKKRIRNGREYQRVFRGGRRLYSPIYALYYQSNKLSNARLGVITSKRNVRKATDRNRIKRIAKEAFRIHQKALDGLDVVIIAQKASREVSRQELRQCLEELLKKCQKNR